MREEIYHNGRTSDEHSAWLDNLKGDERLIVHAPVGHVHTILIASTVKRALQYSMTLRMRSDFLEGLERLIDGRVITEKVMAAIKPADDVSFAMIREADALPVFKKYEVLASVEVFGALAKLNPSLLDALRLCFPDLSTPTHQKEPLQCSA
ncbi:MAG: hypothetical protein NTV56_19335 [Alphaproteobacteria bacterium]|nr:hypothetical protein [Alphaproteobacteria bacterium]